MAINRSTQQRQNYGLGSFVKKTFNKVARPFTKVAQKLMPKELAGIAQIAAPFLGPVYGPLAYAAGSAKQKGKINPFALAATALPYTKFGGSTAESMTGLSRFVPSGYGSMGEGQGLRQLLFQGYNVPGQERQGALLGNKYGTKTDELLFGKDNTFADVQGPREAVPGSSGDTFDITKEGPGLGRKLYEAEGGLLGDKGKFDMFNSKIVDLAIRKKDGTTLDPLKIGAWGMSIYSGIKAAKYKDEIEAADAAEQALLAADTAASEGDILEAREWAQTVFGRLSPADIGLAQGGRVNYAAGSGDKPVIKDSYDVVEEMDNELNPGILKKILSIMGVGKFTYGVDEDQGASLIDEIQDYKYGESYPGETIWGGKDKYGAVIGSIPKPDRPPMSIEETIEALEAKWDEAIEEGYEPGKGGEFDYLGIYKKEDIRRRIELGFDQAKAIGNPLPPDPTAPVNPFKPKPTGPVLPNKMMAAQGGIMNRMNYALGTRPESKESGLGGLPIEADMRYTGGFMPYGKKEKADDVPARLSKNEFVFTADAVKAAGGGSMNEGARKMYQTMKMLEQQNRMMS